MANARKPWADGPWQLINTQGWKSTDVKEHFAIQMALEMVAAHNSMIRGINAIVLQAPNVHSLPDVADLLYLCQIWTISIGHHHTVEERFLFPQVEALSGKPELMAENAEQHRAFHDGLEAFATYAKETKPEAYRWEDMKAVIDAFMPPLYEHLRDEIPTILALRELDSGELKKIWKTLEDHAKGDSERHPQMQDLICCMVGCIDRMHENGLHKNFPPFPFFMPYIVHYLWSRKNKGSWRFLPCDAWSRPKELPFV